MFACSFNELKFSIGLGAGLGMAFFLVQMLSQVSDDIEFLKYLTPLTLFNPENIIKYTNIEQNLNTKNKRERSEEAYHNAAFGAWHEYDDRQKEYVLNYAKENGYFIPSNWIK